MSRKDLDFDRAQRLYREALRHGAIVVTPEALRAAAGVPPAEENELDKVQRAVARDPLFASPNPQKIYRWPYPLVADAVQPDETRAIHVHTYVTMRPTHMILSENTAACFDLVSMMIGNCSQTACDSALPLETFSIKYYADAKDPGAVLHIQKWTHDTINPAMRLTLYVKSREPCGPVSFRGVLWADCLMP